MAEGGEIDDGVRYGTGLEPSSQDGYTAVCDCGWRSGPMVTAALAHAAADAHTLGRLDHRRPDPAAG